MRADRGAGGGLRVAELLILFSLVSGPTSVNGIMRRRTLTVLLGVLSGRWVVSTSWLPPPGSTRIADEEEHEVCAGHTVTLATAEMLWCWSLRKNHAVVMNLGQNNALFHQ